MTNEKGFAIVAAEGADELATIARLFRDYAAGLGIDLGFQGFEAELASLPGRYAAPAGVLLLARGVGGDALGCVAVRPFDRPGACEVKRLYVGPAARGTGLGRRLATAAVDFAAGAGYREALLDTLPSMPTAIALYRSLGFAPIPAYWNNTLPGVLYFRKELGAGR